MITRGGQGLHFFRRLWVRKGSKMQWLNFQEDHSLARKRGAPLLLE